MHRRALLTGMAAMGVGAVSGCAGGDGEGEGTMSTPQATLRGSPTLKSPEFNDGEAIPARFTCQGENVSPALTIGDVPDTASSLALLVDDPDAPIGTFTHWLLWDLDQSTALIPEDVPMGETVDSLDGATQVTNDTDVVGYSGPCPPPEGGAHTYRFRLFALDEPLELGPGAARDAFDDAMADVARSEAVLQGTYDR